MRRYALITAGMLMVAGLAPSPGASQHAHVMALPDTIQWGAAPASLPPGAQAAILHGDPAKPGAFAMRIRMPDAYTIPPHWHPADEHVTVIAGTFVMGLGEQLDRSKGRDLAAGGFAMMPTGTRHFAWTKGETIIQLHGTGPWGITYVNATDDPRQKK